MAECQAIAGADVEAALEAARKTPSDRSSRVADVNRRDCASATNAYIRNARQDLATTGWVKPKQIDFVARLDGEKGHYEQLQGLHREYCEWLRRKDFVAVAGRLAGRYGEALEAAAAAVIELAHTYRESEPLAPEYETSFIMDDGQGKVLVNERPKRAFEQFVLSIAGLWEHAGNTASAERSGATGTRDSPFLRFVSALNERLPEDVRVDPRKLADAVHYILSKNKTP